ncbi:cupin domain-containing protein [Shewanella sp. NIFS-20-20]|uniref:ribosomal protein uL16 3-hydroxylase n=1 Tax=Shewanella sp. NIFS-20-20 TaxID=2853806 RepID=UPI001C46D9CB|nr:cupin domain-containing protein [Shewanella sp. NIFS-20-20]MBV7314574.1 cupin domain-containing protein [Shewanella sp. NIFS-20-20]
MYQLQLNHADFLAQHWQKHPLVIRQGFVNFIDPIEPDELAGLAMEEDLSSRLVFTEGNNWRIQQGPITNFSQLGEQNWQLLVQAVNHFAEQTHPFCNSFRFLPDWRFDDLMVSFAMPGGGVGPHIDNYDVFIIQGSGSRRWTVGPLGEYQQRNNDANSPLIEDFEPIIDTVLAPGDILYIPPGFPHRGYTLEPSMSYSMGFRAPSQQELIGELADYMLDNQLGQHRYVSTAETLPASQFSQQQQQGLMQLLTDLASDPTQYQTVLGRLLSQSRFELDINEMEPELSEDELDEAISEGAMLQRIGGLKVLLLENDHQSRLFANGDAFPLPQANMDQLSLLAEVRCLSGTQLTELCQHHAIKTLLLSWINAGYYYLTE